MSFNLIESVKTVLSGDATNSIAGFLGESSANVQQAIQGIVPAVLTGILLKAESGDIQDTLNLATDAARIDIPFTLNSLSGGTGQARGMDFLKSIFGEKTAALADSISSFSGVSSQSVISLLGIAAPVSLNVLGKHILDSNMNASGLRSFLSSQKKKILNVLPTGIFLEGIMGIEKLSGFSEIFSGSEIVVTTKRSGFKWVLPLTIVVIAVAAVWYFMNKPVNVETRPMAIEDTSVQSRDTVTAPPLPVGQFSIKLPDGVSLNAKKGGIEDQLVNFFTDPDSRPSRRFPYNFDQLTFNGTSAVISNESMVQIQNVAFILKAFPNARIKIGGFNEKGGDSVSNKELSESRASAVATGLKASGASPNQIIGVEGFGSDFAKYTADAADSLKEKDKRISISIRGK